MQFDLRVFKVSSQLLQTCDVRIKLQGHNSGQITTDDKRTLPILLSAHVGAFSNFLTIVSYVLNLISYYKQTRDTPNNAKCNYPQLCAPGANS